MFYASVAVNREYKQPTYATHPWRIRDHNTKLILHDMVPRKAPSEVLVEDVGVTQAILSK